MKKEILFLIVFLIFVSGISASCEKGQININNASLEELDELYGVGPVKAQAIIDTRPFESVNDLIKVHGIGDVTLEKILGQGLACVDSEETYGESITKEKINQTKEIKKQENTSKKVEPVTNEVIKLIPKDIKSEGNKRVLDKKDYAEYGFVIFCTLLGFLFIIKNKRKYKNGPA